MNNVYRLIIFAFIIALSGCATIIKGRHQPVSIEVHHQGKPVEGAQCYLENDKGKWHIITPGKITVHRDYKDLQVACKKETFPSGKMAAKSKFNKTAMFGSLMIGGLISAAVDTKTGAAYDYPDVIRIELAKADDMLLPEPWSPE